jgi:hypothetical protein
MITETDAAEMGIRELDRALELSRDIREFRMLEEIRDRKRAAAQAELQRAAREKELNDPERRRRAGQFQFDSALIQQAFDDFGLNETEKTTAMQTIAEAGRLGDIEYAEAIAVAIVNNRPVEDDFVSTLDATPAEKLATYGFLRSHGWLVNAENAAEALAIVRSEK